MKIEDGKAVLPNSPAIMGDTLAPLREGHPVLLSMTGGSMEPTIHEVSDILVLQPKSRQLHRGDVVLYKRGDQHVLHRVLRVRPDYLVVRGDACVARERVDATAVVALLAEIRRKDGTVIACQGRAWRSMSRKAMRRNAVRQGVRKWLNAKARRRLSPWYMVCLAMLMWLPLDGLGVQLDNFVFGIREDHLWHATVFVPCIWLVPPVRRRRLAWDFVLAFSVALLMEGVQYYLPYRSFDINDIIADLLGIVLGWLVGRGVRRRARRASAASVQEAE